MNLNKINEDSDYFDTSTPGAFILWTNIDSFKLIRAEILNESKNDENITFNLITSGN